MKLFFLFFVVLFSIEGFSTNQTGKLLSATTSSEQDILRVELNFDQLIDSNKISMQFAGKNIIFTIPEMEIKKNPPSLESSVNYINQILISNSKDKSVSLELSFNDLTSMQMKENIALESLGKTLILEILPPHLNKINAPANEIPLTTIQTSTELPPKKIIDSQIKENTDGIAQNDEKSIDESKEVLFEKKGLPNKESNDSSKLIYMTLFLLATGGYLVWFLKNRSKMVNGPESLMKIKMITQFHIGPKKSLVVIRVAGESLLLSVTDSQINLIKSLSLLDEDLPELNTKDFQNTLDEQEEDSHKVAFQTTRDNSNSAEEFTFGPAVKTTLTKKIPGLRKII